MNHRKFTILLFLLAFLLAFPFAAPGADLRVGRRVVIPAGEALSGNVYSAGGEVIVAGDLKGDLVCAGGDVFLTGRVSDDVVAAGGDLHLTGEVGRDVRVAGGRVNLSGQVGGDVLVTGGQVRLLPDATIGGDVVVAAGEVVIESSVRGSVRVAAGDITLNGVVAGPVRVRARSLLIGEQARLAGELTYWAPREAVIDPAAEIDGPTTFYLIAGVDQDWLARALLRIGITFLLVAFLMTLAAGLFGVLVFRKISEDLVRRTFQDFGAGLLRGFILFFVLPAAAFLVTLTVVGLPIALIAGLIHVAFGIISAVYAGIALGSLLWKTAAKRGVYEVTWKTVLIGVPAMALLSLVPVVGLLISAAFFLTVFGELYQGFWLAVRGRVMSK
jgi:cytoskeletal protein CcmA (bactofilin family)